MPIDERFSISLSVKHWYGRCCSAASWKSRGKHKFISDIDCSVQQGVCSESVAPFLLFAVVSVAGIFDIIFW